QTSLWPLYPTWLTYPVIQVVPLLASRNGAMWSGSLRCTRTVGFQKWHEMCSSRAPCLNSALDPDSFCISPTPRSSSLVVRLIVLRPCSSPNEPTLLFENLPLAKDRQPPK